MGCLGGWGAAGRAPPTLRASGAQIINRAPGGRVRYGQRPRPEPTRRLGEPYFERLWTNEGQGFSVPYEAYKDASSWKYWRYRLQESSGMATF